MAADNATPTPGFKPWVPATSVTPPIRHKTLVVNSREFLSSPPFSRSTWAPKNPKIGATAVAILCNIVRPDRETRKEAHLVPRRSFQEVGTRIHHSAGTCAEEAVQPVITGSSWGCDFRVLHKDESPQHSLLVCTAASRTRLSKQKNMHGGGTPLHSKGSVAGACRARCQPAYAHK